MSHLDLVSDHSKEKLVALPKNILEMNNLKMLFLEGNFLTSLPDDIFWKLPKLMWLDLRNNLLESIPKSIANHQCLENLLLTNNNIERLPDELGLVPKLKALQVSENPLVYPVRKIIVEGTKAIKNYLKDQYEKRHPPEIQEDDAEIDDDNEEQLVSIVESGSEEEIGYNALKTRRKTSPNKDLTQELRKKLSDPYVLEPTLNVKKLQTLNVQTRNTDEPVKIVHNISRNGSKISLKSHFNRTGSKLNSSDKVTNNNLKAGWLNQLRILLTDQERIIQQERNLRALSNWRTKKKAETPKTFVAEQHLSPPYAIYPEYYKMVGREELAAQLNDFFKEKGIIRSDSTKHKSLNIEKLINDLMQQLKEMETVYDETRSPRSEIERAGRQIKTVMDIQQKLLRLKASNDCSI